MTSTEIVQFTSGALAVGADQTTWTDQQVAVLHGLGIDEEKVTQAEMDVFLHECQRTALDPFTKQIYLIGRYDSRAGREVFRSQTGIDGYRVVAHRAARRDRVELSYSDTMWCGPDGTWRDVWLDRDNPPFAAKVTVRRNDKPFPAVATLAEYAATYKNGDPTPMWRRMPSTMLAKCAEALALRKAFPQDLAGIYTAEEMEQADNHMRSAPDAAPAPGQAQRQTVRQAGPDPWETPAPAQQPPAGAAAVEYAEVVEQPGPALASQQQLDDLAQGLRVVRGAESPEARRTAVSQILKRELAPGEQLTRPDFERVVSALREEERQNTAMQQQPTPAEQPPAAPPAVADRQEVDWILGGLTAVRGIIDPQSKQVAIEAEVRRAVPDPYTLTANEAAAIRATLEAEYASKQQHAAAAPPRVDEKKKRHLHVAFKGAGIESHDERVAYAGQVVGRSVTTTNALTASEMDQVIGALTSGRTLGSFQLGQRATELESMVASATSSDELAGVGERFWAEFRGGEITAVERDVLVAASQRREMQLAQTARAAA